MTTRFDELFSRPSPDHSGEDAVLRVGGWSSSCSACGRQTLPDALTHERVSGYGPGAEGCHARFASISFDYGDPDGSVHARIRPDLPLASAVSS